MPDRYQQFVTSQFGRQVAGSLGLPTPVRLQRHYPGRPLVSGPVRLSGTTGGRLLDPVSKALHAAGVEVRSAEDEPREPFAGLVFDASGIGDSGQLGALYDFFHPAVRDMRDCGRLLVLGTPPEECETVRKATAQVALEGFVRSIGKEVKRGATAQLVYVSGGAEGEIESTLRFLLSAKSAFVSGQVIRIGATVPDDSTGPYASAGPDSTITHDSVVPDDGTIPYDWGRPLAGKTAIVTGAARGIGEAIAATLARDGAHVVCLDVPAQGEALSAVANPLGGAALQLDITRADAPRVLAEYIASRHGYVDAVVHNAGVTRDKTLARMSEEQWSAVLDINLSAAERINDVVLGEGLLRPNGRIVGVSSLTGIAGNRGQVNYATSKVGVIGMVRALAPQMRDRGLTINAVAPGFIETAMTAAMPVAVREAGRRMNSLSQGGLPVDVAETVAWLTNPASAGVNGNIVRVCGQSLLGA